MSVFNPSIRMSKLAKSNIIIYYYYFRTDLLMLISNETINRLLANP